MENKYLVVADDFTGSNDTGVQLKKNNINVDVLLFPSKESVENSVVLDTESRGLSGEDAYQKVRTLTSDLLEKNQFSVVYKKIDSTLRGNVAKEIHAMLDIYSPDLVVMAPAFPKINRTTKNAIHYLSEAPLMETEIANDPLTPIWTDNICEILKAEFNEPIKNISTEELEDLQHFPEDRFQVFDIEEERDLKKIRELTRDESRRILYVGSAGLAEYLFKKEELPTLSVVGSISEVSLEQMDYAKNKGFNVINIEINDLIIENRIEKYTKIVCESLANGLDTIITVTRKKQDYLETIELFKSLDIMDKREVSRIIKETLAKITKNVLPITPVSSLFLTGGDIAIEVINELDGKGCKIQEELTTGIVESRLVGGKHDGMVVITKAGAFGNKDSLYLSLKQEER
ncbi:membrane protein [Tetragenococcus halophilus subsp. flandriensis]|uniref:four-carbon acid sugar kinase family protein n=1 Tax=Tetragenococcus halophilus TaxID=51669 RepID=UPI0023E933B6|nr:four-carbon acid sugar kinase family protein [Tetragenococcus halophilus]GMA08357.1 membrane protein [Tetragenococcus halophilus subsp. flandriensis]